MRPPHDGVHTQSPVDEQVFPVEQVPHEPPQPSLPHALPVQSGVQVPPGVHWPAALQFSLGWHAPQSPPQPSLPHARPLHEGVHVELASVVRYVSRSVVSHSGSVRPGGIVLSTSARVRMRLLQRRTSASVSKSTPSVAPARATPVTFTEWHERQRVRITPGPSLTAHT